MQNSTSSEVWKDNRFVRFLCSGSSFLFCFVYVAYEIQRCTNIHFAKVERGIKNDLIPLPAVKNFFEIEDAVIAKLLDSSKSFHSSDSQLISSV